MHAFKSCLFVFLLTQFSFAKARAPKSQVIVVGTHLDRMPQAKRKEHLSKLESDIFRKFAKKGFPIISGNVFVSNSTNEGVAKLKEIIYKVTSKMQDSNLLEPMIGKKVNSFHSASFPVS